ncbi:carbohydrate ABC transporter permease [Roseomonas sp. CCTCC AB2023176]|uniref:carbohydrate ABC transporter permease n=1 Tax=Roseomonas sp. CCTCC AB2023176 TaxID=3342640 RepID=UPI0035D9AECD
MSGAATAVPARARAARAPRPGGVARRQARFGLLLALPPMAVFGAMILYPFLDALRRAFYEDTLMSTEPIFIGFGNFAQLWEDGTILGTWVVTVVFVVLATAFTFLLGLAWAVVLNERFPARALVRSVSLLPWVLPSTVVAFLWAWMLNGQYGLLNAVLLSLGLLDQPVAWLATPGGAMAGVVLAKVWLSIPLFTAFLLAGLQSLPQEQIEAARIDGAANRHVLRHVAWPHLRPTIAVLVVLGALGNLQQFDVIYAMTGGGPVRATTVMSIEVQRQAFQSWNIGLAAAVGVVWFLTILGPAFLRLRTIMREV